MALRHILRAHKHQAPKGDITSHTEGPQTSGASVQNSVVMATWLLGLEHLQIRKVPRASKFFPVHHSPTSPPPSQYETMTQRYNRIIHINPSPEFEPRNLPATELDEIESYLKIVQPITKLLVFQETKTAPPPRSLSNPQPLSSFLTVHFNPSNAELTFRRLTSTTVDVPHR